MGCWYLSGLELTVACPLHERVLVTDETEPDLPDDQTQVLILRNLFL